MADQQIELEAHIPMNIVKDTTEDDIAGEAKTGLAGNVFEIETPDGKIVHFKIKNVSTSDDQFQAALKGLTSQSNRIAGDGPEDGDETDGITARREENERVSDLIGDSTNLWLYAKETEMEDDDDEPEEPLHEKCQKCGNDMINYIIAILVVIIQICSYIAMTYFLVQGVKDDHSAQQETCYGPSCGEDLKVCIKLTTGSLVSVMLIGFIWADVINVFGLLCSNPIASCILLCEIFTAIICGFLVGLYSESDFDAIGGAVGILFVHDLDEQVYASMGIIANRKKRSALIKKLLFVFCWIAVSLILGLSLACKYNNNSIAADAQHGCIQGEFQCEVGAECIWEGFVCNGVEDCPNGEDEGDWIGLGKSQACNYVEDIVCPEDYFVCLSTGNCLEIGKKCDGIVDCEDGSDEGRVGNCAQFIADKECDEKLTVTYPTAGDDWHQTWSGQFKCNNGQCIEASFACDGTAGDCVDGSDEYPYFNQINNPLLNSSVCPYSKLLTAPLNYILCKSDGQFIYKDQLCDGVIDCSDGLDEQGCQYLCNANNAIADLTYFQCNGPISSINDTHIIYFVSENTAPVPYHNKTDLYALVPYIIMGDTGKCIPYQYRCDGIKDCEDGSDEFDCYLFDCEDWQFACASGDCIPKTWLCDGANDCTAGEDEDYFGICLPNNVTVPYKSCAAMDPNNHWDDILYYNCINTDYCKWRGDMCDGWNDCANGDDEIGENCLNVWLRSVGGDITQVPSSIINWDATPTPTDITPSPTLPINEIPCDGSLVNGTVFPGDSEAWFVINLLNDTRTIEISTCHRRSEYGTNPLRYFNFGLYDESFALLRNSETYYDLGISCSAGGSSKGRIFTTTDGGAGSYVEANGKYYVKVISNDAEWYDGDFAINMICQTTLPTEQPTPTPTSATMICDGNVTYNEIFEIGGEQTYQVTIPLTATSIEVSTCDQYSVSVVGTKLSMYDVSHAIVAYSDDGGWGRCPFAGRLSYLELNTSSPNPLVPGNMYEIKVEGDYGKNGIFGIWSRCT